MWRGNNSEHQCTGQSASRDHLWRVVGADLCYHRLQPTQTSRVLLFLPDRRHDDPVMGDAGGLGINFSKVAIHSIRDALKSCTFGMNSTLEKFSLFSFLIDGTMILV